MILVPYGAYQWMIRKAYTSWSSTRVSCQGCILDRRRADGLKELEARRELLSCELRRRRAMQRRVFSFFFVTALFFSALRPRTEATKELCPRNKVARWLVWFSSRRCFSLLCFLLSEDRMSPSTLPSPWHQFAVRTVFWFI